MTQQEAGLLLSSSSPSLGQHHRQPRYTARQSRLRPRPAAAHQPRKMRDCREREGGRGRERGGEGETKERKRDRNRGRERGRERGRGKEGEKDREGKRERKRGRERGRTKAVSSFAY